MGLVVTATAICHEHEIIADFPLTVVSIAIVFPIVFSINSAFRRRETALKYLSDFKVHGQCIYYAARDWNNGQASHLAPEIKAVISNCLEGLKTFFLSKKVDAREREKEVYEHFSQLSKLVEQLREHGISGGELSRVNQYQSKMMVAFDNMKIIYHYRTPLTLRAYSKVFIYTFPFLYGPSFAGAFGDNSVEWLGYILPVIISFIIASLDNIQDHLENPYDQIGEDDIKIDLEELDDMLCT